MKYLKKLYFYLHFVWPILIVTYSYIHNCSIKQNMHVWVDLIIVSREWWHINNIKSFFIKMKPTNTKKRTSIFRLAYYTLQISHWIPDNFSFKDEHLKLCSEICIKLSGQKTSLWGEKVLSTFAQKWSLKKSPFFIKSQPHSFKLWTLISCHLNLVYMSSRSNSVD